MCRFEEFHFEASTDTDGYFDISQDCLPFGQEFIASDEVGNDTGMTMISRDIQLWALHPDYNNSYEEAYIGFGLNSINITLDSSD